MAIQAIQARDRDRYAPSERAQKSQAPRTKPRLPREPTVPLLPVHDAHARGVLSRFSPRRRIRRVI
jgi:hypothetical protein